LSTEAKVLDQDFYADGDKNQAAENFDFVFKEMTESFSDDIADVGQGEGDYADQADGKHDGMGDQRKGKSYRQRVDACGDAENQQGDQAGWIRGFLFNLFNLEGFIDHFSPDNDQQNKGQPMIVDTDKAFKGFSGRKPQERHQ